MTQIIYKDGQFVDHKDAVTHINDRGYQFADSVYEGIGFFDGCPMGEDGHYARLADSLESLSIPMPISIEAFKIIVERLLKLNHIKTGFVYIQVSRGIAAREHSSFELDVEPVVLITAKHTSLASMRSLYELGIRVGTIPDIRWGRCDIKTTGLLANCLAKTAANSQGYSDAWLYDVDGFITEATAANAWIVDQKGVLRTRHLSSQILRGITRTDLLKMLENQNFSETPFTIEEAYSAKEAFITSASLGIRPVVSIDDKPIADGQRGRVTHQLQKSLMGHIGAHLPELLGLNNE